MKSLSFFVHGRAATSGSKRGFALKKGGAYTGRVAMMGDNPREKDWKNSVASWAIARMKSAGITEPLSSPIRLEITFFLQRPAYHFNTKGQVNRSFPTITRRSRTPRSYSDASRTPSVKSSGGMIRKSARR